MKKLLALFLSVLMVFSMATLLSSCGDSDDDDDTKSSSVSENESGKKEKKKSSKRSSKSDEELIVGTWELEIDIAPILEDTYESILGKRFDLSEVSPLKANYIFKRDGDMKVEFDEDSLEDFLSTLAEEIAGQYTSDPSTIKALKKQIIQSAKSGFANSDFSGEYKFKNDKLVFMNTDSDISSTLTYKFVNDDEIKITDFESTNTENAGILSHLSDMLPLTLRRV